MYDPNAGRHIAEVLHDVRNELSTVASHARLLLQRSVADEQVARPAEQVASAVERIDRMLRMLALEYEEDRCPWEPVYPVRVVRGVVDEWAATAAERGVELCLFAAETPPVLGDPIALHRVFENLVRNAIEGIGSPPGRIEVRVETVDPSKVRVSVDDGGAGVAVDLESVVRFVTTKHGGRGLGLAIARKIVEDHGGGLSFERRPGGVRVDVELPVAAASVTAPFASVGTVRP